MIMLNIFLLKKLVNKFTTDKFAARLVQAKLTTKDEIAGFIKRQILIIN